MIHVLLVDDEPHANGLLKNIIVDQFPDLIQIIGIASNVKEARNVIFSTHVDLVFLDVQMPEENGFELFKYFPNPTFDVIFVTAYDRYAIQAFKYAAFDYLLKPIDSDLLNTTLQRYLSQKTVIRLQKEQILLLNTYINNTEESKKRMYFNTANGVEIPLINSILYIAADKNYSDIYTKDGNKIVVSQSLKAIEDRLPKNQFIRTHKSYLVAVNAIVKYDKNEKRAILNNGDSIDVSYRRENDFLNTVLENI